MTHKLDPQVMVIAQVITKRKHQDAQWGGAAHDDEHTLYDWLSYIGHQADRICDVLGNNGHYNFAEQRGIPVNPGVVRMTRDHFISIAALAVATVEAIDRSLGKDVQSHDD